MADIVTTRILHPGTKSYVIQLTNESDGSGEASVKKVDLSDLTTQSGLKPESLTIQKIQYQVNGFNYVTLYWDRTPSPETAVVLFGQGVLDYKSEYGGLKDPKHSQDGTGNILLTTDGATDGDSYTLIIEFKLES
jgi:hypothetical protein